MDNQNLQLFAVNAENRQDPSARSTFLIEAESHRDAWRVAREVCKTGRGAKLRDLANHELLHQLPLTPGALTVKRVLSTNVSRRGRPPKLTVDDLTSLAERNHVSVPPRVRRVIQELANLA